MFLSQYCRHFFKQEWGAKDGNIGLCWDIEGGETNYTLRPHYRLSNPGSYFTKSYAQEIISPLYEYAYKKGEAFGEMMKLSI